MELSETGGECCMCGDYGLSEELFQCKVCLFRFQHRYCSNLYPKAESYRVCNWCLSKKQEKPVPPNSSDSSLLSSKRSGGEGEGTEKRKGSESDCRKGQNREKMLDQRMRGSEGPSPERTFKKRIITRRELEEKLRRTRAEELSKQQHGFRNKGRRYKLLDEVSS